MLLLLLRVLVCVQVLYSKFGFMYTDIKLGEEEFILIREDDVIGELTSSGTGRRAGFRCTADAGWLVDW
jgi:hypothetical protein